jgi:hypothetical protein
MTSEEKDLAPAALSDSTERKIAFLCLLCAIPVYMVVAHFAGEGRGRAAAACIGVNVLVVVLRRKSIGKLGFWIAMSLILLIQTMVIVVAPFGDQSLPPYGLIPAGLVIYLFDEGVIYLFGALSGTRPQITELSGTSCVLRRHFSKGGWNHRILMR